MPEIEAAAVEADLAGRAAVDAFRRVCAAAESALGAGEMEAVSIELAPGDDGLDVVVRGPARLVDRIEAALYPADEPGDESGSGAE